MHFTPGWTRFFALTIGKCSDAAFRFNRPMSARVVSIKLSFVFGLQGCKFVCHRLCSRNCILLTAFTLASTGDSGRFAIDRYLEFLFQFGDFFLELQHRLFHTVDKCIRLSKL